LVSQKQKKRIGLRLANCKLWLIKLRPLNSGSVSVTVWVFAFVVCLRCA